MANEFRLAAAAIGFLAAGLFSAAQAPSLSFVGSGPESRYTDLVSKSCAADAVTPAYRGDEQVKSCPGLGGARVVIAADPDQVTMGYEWSPREKAEDVVRNWGLGFKLEWRGVETRRGFEPHATIVRVLFKDGSGPIDPAVLAVTRVRRGEACLIALVDAASNPDAYDLARRLADGRARSVSCGLEPPRIEGVPTARASALLARL